MQVPQNQLKLPISSTMLIWVQISTFFLLTNEQMDGWTDKKSPHSTGLRPLSEPLPKNPYIIHFQDFPFLSLRFQLSLPLISTQGDKWRVYLSLARMHTIKERREAFCYCAPPHSSSEGSPSQSSFRPPH